MSTRTLAGAIRSCYRFTAIAAFGVSFLLASPGSAAQARASEPQPGPRAPQRNECPGRTTVQVAADCIERGVYQPCDIGGRESTLDCAWAYAEVAERRIKKAEREVIRLFRANGAGKKDLDALAEWQGTWLAFRSEHCALSERLVEFQASGSLRRVVGGTSLNRGFCTRRLTEARAAELEELVGILTEGH